MSQLEPGKCYIVIGDQRIEVPSALAAIIEPRVWICRRVADFPFGEAPADSLVEDCGGCGEPIAYKPNKPFTAPRRCAQCEGITALPMAVTS